MGKKSYQKGGLTYQKWVKNGSNKDGKGGQKGLKICTGVRELLMLWGNPNVKVLLLTVSSVVMLLVLNTSTHNSVWST